MINDGEKMRLMAEYMKELSDIYYQLAELAESNEVEDEKAYTLLGKMMAIQAKMELLQ